MPILLLMADIHANLSALEAVLTDSCSRYGSDMPICQLGDVIDYGPRPNEVVERLAGLGSRLWINLAGNHEDVLFGHGRERLSSDRGRGASTWTDRMLRQEGRDYLRRLAPGFQELTINDQRLLFVHGAIHDPYWGRLGPEERQQSVYWGYDYIISGHSHIPHLDIALPPLTNSAPKTTAVSERPSMESARSNRSVFLNPGSVGQPRDRDPRAHYAVLDLDSGRVCFEAVPYDIAAEASLFDDAVDPYYWRRLFIGT